MESTLTTYLLERLKLTLVGQQVDQHALDRNLKDSQVF